MNIPPQANTALTDGWQWNTGYAALGPAFLTAVPTQALAHPYLVGYSTAAAQLIGLNADALHSPQWQQVLAGNATPPGCQAAASVYSGHQFGVWAGQLGDGRATLLGEIAPVADDSGVAQELQLKGAGLTPFSRMGDGRAVLRSSIREFLCSEAMQEIGRAHV